MPYYPPPRATDDNNAPLDHGLKAWSSDPAVPTLSTIIPTAGLLHIVKLPLRSRQTISSAWTSVTTAGATLTNVGFALYSSAGALLTSSVNVNGATATAFQSTGSKQVTFTAQTIGPGSFYVAFWFTGTTLPTLMRNSVLAAMNFNLAAPNLRYATADAALTTAAPATLGAQTAASAAFWAAAS